MRGAVEHFVLVIAVPIDDGARDGVEVARKILAWPGDDVRSACRSSADCALDDRARAPSGSDAERSAQLAEQGDGGEVGELAGSWVFRRDVLDLDHQPPELALHDDAVAVQ